MEGRVKTIAWHSLKKITQMSEIDFNKLIRDIISAARGEANANLSSIRPLEDDNKLNITLKLEVMISKNSERENSDNQKSSRKLVLLTMNDHQ